MVKKLLALCFCILATLPGGAFAATYTITSTSNYTRQLDFTAPCAGGVCTNFALTMGASGSFEVPLLAPNLVNSNISASVTAYSFTDGINTYSSTDPDSRKFLFQVTTNASGILTSANILVEKWLTGTRPHTTADYFSYLQFSGSSVPQAYHNDRYITVGVSGGETDVCTVQASETTRSRGIGATVSYSGGGLLAATTTAAIPTLSDYALLLLGALIAGVAGWQLRRRGAV